VTYNPDIPTPQQFLGYQLGEQHITPYENYAYMRELARLSDRITVETYGKTYENRELLLLTVTSPANQARINEIKAEHKKLVNSETSRSVNTANMPIVVWMGYSVHGNEASGANSSLLSAYHLAAAQGAEIDELLKNTVILIDPCINPDGGNRFATWVNHNRSQTLVSDNNSREFSETWPGGRTNHYWFDLNRDWLYQQLPESRGRLVKFYEWRPNILTDHHEMGSGSTFFFQPGIPERTNPNTPKSNIALTAKIGEYHAKGLDKIGSFYYTQENYDDFYYGKGSTLPDVNGSVGILFEQASSRGHLQETPNGVMSFAFTIRNQFSATLSTLKAAKEMRVEMLDHMKNFYQEKADYPTKAYVFGGGNDAASTWEMVNMMKRNDIKINRLKRNESIDGKQFTTDNAFVVSTNQPQHRLINSLFEKRTTFEDSAFYDVSAWTIPLCMNVPYAESKSAISLGDEVTNNAFPQGKVVGESSYAYVFEWNSYFAPRAAYELMQKGYRLKVARSPFKAVINNGEKQFGYGTIQVIAKGGSEESAMLKTLAERDAIDIYAINTGLTSSGIDLGSEQFMVLEMPKPLMLVGSGVDNTDAGEVWHLLDTRVNIPLTMVDVDRVGRINLSDYTHLIMVSGNYGDLSKDQIQRFVSGGGVIVGMSEATQWLSRNGLSSVKFKDRAKSTDDGTKQPYALRDDYSGAMATAGTIFETKIDPSHPICYGYDQTTLPIFKVNNISFEDTGDPYNTPVMFTANPLMAGYVHPRNEKNIKNSPAIIAQRSGRGRIISMSDNPNFRAFWYGTNKLFLNSIFFGKVVESGRYGE
ncbi:MAG: M14 family metallopeptidase, partial [Spirosomaceae bacterium]|nr:M14 family metallopeptidase [Spirosomataceae bacterium]